jgi:FkbM family methyltransferase
MSIQASGFPLQRVIQTLPRPLQRIRLAQLLATLAGSTYHRVRFQQGELIGNVRDGSVANSLVRGTFADYGYFELAGHLLNAGDVHVDLGANYGFHTFGLLASPSGPRVEYVLIDANPDCIGCLRESAKLHPAVAFHIVHAAAAVKAGEIKFTFSPDSTGGGHVGAAADAKDAEIIVPASPLDELFAQHGIDRIALMKMDIEGSEPFAMQSLQRMLSSHRVDFVYFEVNPTCLELQRTSAEALFAEFTRHGYRLFWPHDGVDWILKTYGAESVPESALKRFSIVGSAPHRVIEFDPTLYRKGRFGQCDLLAVSPRCRVDAHSLA